MITLEDLKKLSPFEIVGWMYAYACMLQDNNIDIRNVEAETVVSQFLIAMESLLIETGRENVTRH